MRKGGNHINSIGKEFRISIVFIFTWKSLCKYDTILLSIYKLFIQQTQTGGNTENETMEFLLFRNSLRHHPR